MRSVPPVSSVRLSGKNATDHTGRPGPTSVRSTIARGAIDDRDRAANAGGGDELAVGRHGHGDDRHGADLDLAPELAVRCQEIDLAVGAGGDDLAIGRNRHRVERRRQRDDLGRAARERPDAQRRVVARAHDRLAVGRERDAVHILLVAFEHARRRRPRAATAARCDPTTPRRASRHPAKPRAPRPAPCGLRSTRGRLRLAGLPDRDARVLAADAARPSRSSATALTAPSWKRSTSARRPCAQRPADRGGVEAAGDRGLAVRRDRERAHRAAMSAQLRLRRGSGCNEDDGNKNNAYANHHRNCSRKSGIRGAHAERLDARRARARHATRRGTPAPPAGSRRLSTTRKSYSSGAIGRNPSP